MTNTTTRIFISYRRTDSADISGRIYDRLVARFGDSIIFKDVNSIPFGVNFKKYLEDMVNQCAVELVIIGKQWLDCTNEFGFRRLDDPTDFVRIEIEAALRRGIPVIPLLVQGASMPRDRNLPASLADLSFRNAAMVRPDPDFHNDMDRVVVSLEKWLTELPAKPITLTRMPGPADTQPVITPSRQKIVKLVLESDTLPSRPDALRRSKMNANLTAFASLEWANIKAGTVTVQEHLLRSGLRVRDRIQNIPAFRIGKYPVTNSEFQAFVDAKNGYADAHWWEFSPHAQQWHNANPRALPPAFPGDDNPRENINWFEALAFCKWLSQLLALPITLPTEAQWQRAAQGDDQREYPWGNEFDVKRSNVEESGVGKTTPVYRYQGGSSPFHVWDMLGNVEEWCLNDPSNLRTVTPETEQYVRGGAWKLKKVRLTQRSKVLAGQRLNYVGFRLVSPAISAEIKKP